MFIFEFLIFELQVPTVEIKVRQYNGFSERVVLK